MCRGNRWPEQQVQEQHVEEQQIQVNALQVQVKQALVKLLQKYAPITSLSTIAAILEAVFLNSCL